MTDDLFAALAPMTEPSVHVDCPKRCHTVASFACDCGYRDEVLEPAPATVDCWNKGCPGPMRRWSPRIPPPSGNARQATDAERARIR